MMAMVPGKDGKPWSLCVRCWLGRGAAPLPSLPEVAEVPARMLTFQGDAHYVPDIVLDE